MYYFNFESKYITHLLMAKFVWIILCTHDKILVLFPQKKKKKKNSSSVRLLLLYCDNLEAIL